MKVIKNLVPVCKNNLTEKHQLVLPSLILKPYINDWNFILTVLTTIIGAGTIKTVNCILN